MADFILFASISAALVTAALIGGRIAYLIAAVVALGVMAAVFATTPVSELHGWGLLAGLIVGGAIGALITSRKEV